MGRKGRLGRVGAPTPQPHRVTYQARCPQGREVGEHRVPVGSCGATPGHPPPAASRRRGPAMGEVPPHGNASLRKRFEITVGGTGPLSFQDHPSWSQEAVDHFEAARDPEQGLGLEPCSLLPKPAPPPPTHLHHRPLPPASSSKTHPIPPLPWKEGRVKRPRASCVQM